MNLVSDIARRSDGWGWFFVWALFGSSWALAAVSLGPLLLIPTALLGVFLWRRRPAARRSAFGLLTGAGVLLLYVAWLQRDGPGTTTSPSDHPPDRARTTPSSGYQISQAFRTPFSLGSENQGQPDCS